MVARILQAFVSAIIVAVSVAQPAIAITNPTVVSLDVSDTVLHLFGQSSPHALVTASEDGNAIGSTTADATGSFSLMLGGQATGIRTIQLSYKDSAGVTSAVFARQVSVQTQHTTDISVFLAPTITKLSPASVQSGSIVQINGHTVPSAVVTLSLGVSGSVQTTQASSAGFYEFLLNTSALATRTYTAYVQASTPSLGQSQPSENVSFSVAQKGAPSQPDLIVLPNQLSPPVSILPEDGTKINGNTVEITGESAPFAQISVYQNGKIIGSVFANAFGKWSFNYVANDSSVALTFEACLAGICSVQTQPYTYYFSYAFSSAGGCLAQFELTTYRFWDVKIGEPVSLSLRSSEELRGILDVNWDDGTKEKFSIDTSSDPLVSKRYLASGHFNGSVTYTDSSDVGGCSTVRYFSVGVIEGTSVSRSIWLGLIGAAAIVLIFAYRLPRYAHKK